MYSMILPIGQDFIHFAIEDRRSSAIDFDSEGLFDIVFKNELSAEVLTKVFFVLYLKGSGISRDQVFPISDVEMRNKNWLSVAAKMMRAPSSQRYSHTMDYIVFKGTVQNCNYNSLFSETVA